MNMKLEKIIAVRTDKTVYRDGDLAVKGFGSHYDKADILNEALNQARVEEIGLNVPRVEEVCKIDGKWAIVSDFIPGKTLARLMEENPDRRDEYMDLFVDLQLKMHAQTCPLLGKLKDKMNRKINETGLDATTRYELHARLQGMPNHKKLCHGDFDPKNIILRDDGEPFILDWAHATQGNASADVARTYLWFCLNKLTEEAAQMMEEEVGKHGAIIGRMPLDHDLGLAGLTGTELQMTIAPVSEMAQFLIQ